jgi:hypothetical protein
MSRRAAKGQPLRRHRRRNQRRGLRRKTPALVGQGLIEGRKLGDTIHDPPPRPIRHLEEAEAHAKRRKGNGGGSNGGLA